MYLLMDIGGTKTRIALSEDKKIISKAEIIPSKQIFQEAIDEMKKTIAKISDGQKIEAAALGINGVLDEKKTKLAVGVHLPAWEGKNLKEELQSIIQAPIYMENDALMAGLGEANFGAGKDYQIVVYVTVSTGINGCRIVQGKYDPLSLKFELGHQIIQIDGEICPGCGQKGHLESYASGAGLKLIYNKNAEEITGPEVWDETARYLAIGLNNTIVHFSPDCVVLGGSMMKSLSLDSIKKHLKEVLKIYPICPEILEASLGELAGTWGALALLNQLTSS